MSLSEDQIKTEKRIIYKNVLLISVSFLLLFVAFESMSKLQSSINVVSLASKIFYFLFLSVNLFRISFFYKVFYLSDLTFISFAVDP